MAGNPIVGRYKLYKQGTTKLIQWLAQAAGACCDLTSILKALQGQSTICVQEPTSIVKRSNKSKKKDKEAV